MGCLDPAVSGPSPQFKLPAPVPSFAVACRSSSASLHVPKVREEVPLSRPGWLAPILTSGILGELGPAFVQTRRPVFTHRKMYMTLFSAASTRRHPTTCA